MINSNFDILEQSSWNSLLLANDFAIRPAVANANTNIEGVEIAGQVAGRNKIVKVPRAVKITGDAREYSGTYTQDVPDFTNEQLSMDDIYYRSFNIDKWDSSFSFVDFVGGTIKPYMENVIDTIESAQVKRELDRFNSAVVDLNTTPTVMNVEDIRFMRKTLLKRGLVNPSSIKAGLIDPDAEFDLNGLSLFNDASQRGNSDVQIEGAMGKAFGFNFMLGHNTRTVSTDSATGDAVVAGAHSVGDTTITIDDGSGGASDTTLANGDVIYFGTASGRDNWYVVDSVNAGKTEITLKEPLRYALTDNDAITGVAGDCQYFYDTSSIALVTAIPQESAVMRASGATRIPFYEPVNKINFLITIEGNTSGGLVTIETLVGAKNFQPSRGARYIKGTADKA